MSIACETTPEQKETIWKSYRDIIKSDGSTNGVIDNYPSYPNIYLSKIWQTVGQTSRSPKDYDAEKYFVWVNFEEFKRLCLNTLIVKRKIKL